ncbi:hypothetical protein CANTEDRAFT_97099 [Yamadazyma tenuis ATCC 10573]|uniref:LCCL domain-containing protein n=1 Tax=Candida tenuis (strain ATCC 10573 / BCRC 21748 / CBS 615 / JCM 9827 / NBRC 10315 / NRRL Y-1498 / VKM Y-70) TaxID=590646 RepID=G3AZ89_CANTC|nr:uncharacterized protein CANTEDRAFT_97099 [Yamadazyma tenuis ATCC 10573]EGV66035.1 hypothetical protein CANTEDRAFT_97099 [Yamadazyma tenuis ATCC 10573]
MSQPSPKYSIDTPYSEDIPLQNLTYTPAKQTFDADDMSSADPESPAITAADLPEDPLLDQELRPLWHGPSAATDDPPTRFTGRASAWLEEIPDKFDRLVSFKGKLALLTGYLILWYLCIHSILFPYFMNPPLVDVAGTTPVRTLGCTDQFWHGKNGACGMDAQDCVPNPSQSDVFVRCPALCDRSWTYSLIPMGPERVKYRGYFIGGGDDLKSSSPAEHQLSNPYRADSFVCGAAVHAGVISPLTGGCARVSYKSGGQPRFESAKGHYGVDDSLGFNSFFPASFFFKVVSGSTHQCYDPRIPVLVMNIVLAVPIVYLASGMVAFWTINTVGFWTIVLATDPPVQVDSSDRETAASLISVGLERFLPSCFILYVLWRASTHQTLTAPENFKTSYLKRVLLFCPFFWLGVLNNISFDRLPVDRLTVADLKEQAGGAVAVGGIVLLITTCAIIQAYKIWKAGKFKKYLVIYVSFILGLVAVSMIPGLTLRVHHYILAMLLIPGCSTRGSTAIMFQGILLGLFLSGAARWGLAAIAETDTSLRRNDPSGKVLPPVITGFDVSSGILSWNNTINDAYDGISILVNDIERYVGTNVTGVNLKQLFKNSTELSNLIETSLGASADNSNIPLYIRIGKKIMGTKRYSDFSNAAVITWPEGHIDLPNPGNT